MQDEQLNTVGEIFRTAREAKKLTMDEVNRETKISVRLLQAMEQDDLDAFESDIYLKGFVKSYARFLKLDVDHVIRTLERQRGSEATGRGTLWDIEESMKEEKLKSPRIFRRFVLPALILLILILSYLLIEERNKVRNVKTDNRQGLLIPEGAGDIAADRANIGTHV